jgi:hypothetical protein
MPKEVTAQEFKEASWALRMYLHGSDEGGCYQIVLDFLAQIERQRDSLRHALADLLNSADASWEERGLGHDWPEACEQARQILKETQFA